MTAFGSGEGDGMHMRVSKAKCDGGEHSVLGREKKNVTEIAWPAQLKAKNHLITE